MVCYYHIITVIAGYYRLQICSVPYVKASQSMSSKLGYYSKSSYTLCVTVSWGDSCQFFFFFFLSVEDVFSEFRDKDFISAALQLLCGSLICLQQSTAK